MEEKFNYFIERTENDLRAINEKLDQLINFRLMLLGAAASLSVIFSIATTLAVLFFSKGG